MHQLPIRAMPCFHSNEIRAPIANPRCSAQLGGTPTIPPSYIRVRAVVRECGKGQTDRQTDTHTHTQTCVTTIDFASSTTVTSSSQFRTSADQFSSFYRNVRRTFKVSRTTRAIARALYSHEKDSEESWVFRRPLRTGREGTEMTS